MRITRKRISDWLPIVFHFGTEDRDEQLKKAPCILFELLSIRWRKTKTATLTLTFFSGGEEKRRRKKKENIWRRRIPFFWRRRKTEKEKEEKNGEGKYSFAEEMENRERKGGEILEKENISFAEAKKNGEEKEENIFLRRRRKRRRKRREIFGEGKYFLVEEKKK